jgi:hypothetical protein
MTLENIKQFGGDPNSEFGKGVWPCVLQQIQCCNHNFKHSY